MQLFDAKKHLTLWIADAKDGNVRAQRHIYDALADKMYAVCLRYADNAEDAQDILQDGFVTLFGKLDTYSGEGSFEGWARKIFVNTALMALRKNSVLKEASDVEEAFNVSSEDPSALSKIGYKDLLKMIEELPSGARTVFNLYAVEGFSHKEIAEMLGITEVGSRTQYMRARAVLQDKIKRR